MKQSEKSMQEINGTVQTAHKKGFWRTLLAFLGPAYMVSVGYMDPGNWATDIAGGSQFGYKLIWVLLMSNIMALLLQTLSARLGIVKGWDLAQASRQQYKPWANISLYVLAEIAIIACDLAEIIGMAIGLKLLFNLPLMWGVIITAFDTFLLLFLINKGIRKMEAFILVLVAVIGVSFILEMLIVQPDIVAISKGLVPSALSDGALYIAIGIIGATVMPHNLYLHSSLVQTRNFPRDREGLRKAIKFNFIDSAIALNLAFFVNAAILVLAGAAFYNKGFYQVSDIQDAHLLLQNLFGNLAPTLFAIALIAAGQSSTITGTLAGQIVMEGYLNLRVSPWLRRSVTRLLAIMPAIAAIYFYGDQSMGDLLVFSQVVLSMQLGFAVVPLIHFNSSKKIMGEFATKKLITVFAWLVAAIIITLNIKLVIDEITGLFETLQNHHLWVKIFVLLAAAYLAWLLVYIIVLPLFRADAPTRKVVPHADGLDLVLYEARPYKHIAMTVEFSDKDEKTISEALSLGGKEGVYTLIHVVETAGAIHLGAEILDAETSYDRQQLNAYKQKLAAQGYTAKVILGFGKSTKAITDIIQKGQYDLLIMQAHGHKAFKDFVFGSTVDTVRHNVNIPVLIVKP
jgi:manganese transport protein